MSAPLQKPLFRWPSLRSPNDVLILLGSVGMTVYVIWPELWGIGKSKDYPLWYWVGQEVMQSGDIYADFKFLYPPLPAVLLALPSCLGKVPLYLGLCVVNAVTWWLTATLCNAMAGSDPRTLPRWLVTLPNIAMLWAIVELFDLGQPNLLLLMFMLFGFLLLQGGRPWAAGSLFALATGFKAFPVAVLPYLLWRRHWVAAFSMVVFVLAFVFVVPATVRGFERNLTDVETWFRGMVALPSEQGFGQRDVQNWSWVNQSVIAVTHRLVRPVDYNQDPQHPAYVNVLNLDFTEASWVLAVVCLALGASFIAVMPPRARVTVLSQAEELGILFCLMTICSPLARQYYFSWLFFPVTVMMQRATFDPRPRMRFVTWALLVIAGALMLLSVPQFSHLFQALGNFFFATLTIAGGLAWHLRNPPPVPCQGTERYVDAVNLRADLIEATRSPRLRAKELPVDVGSGLKSTD